MSFRGGGWFESESDWNLACVYPGAGKITCCPYCGRVDEKKHGWCKKILQLGCLRAQSQEMVYVSKKRKKELVFP